MSSYLVLTMQQMQIAVNIFLILSALNGVRQSGVDNILYGSAYPDGSLGKGRWTSTQRDVYLNRKTDGLGPTETLRMPLPAKYVSSLWIAPLVEEPHVPDGCHSPSRYNFWTV